MNRLQGTRVNPICVLSRMPTTSTTIPPPARISSVPSALYLHGADRNQACAARFSVSQAKMCAPRNLPNTMRHYCNNPTYPTPHTHSVVRAWICAPQAKTEAVRVGFNFAAQNLPPARFAQCNTPSPQIPQQPHFPHSLHNPNL
jgi:hypothetical protein